MSQPYEYTRGFNAAVRVVSHEYRKEFALLRLSIMDAMWELKDNTRTKILDALIEFEKNSDWNFGL
jgi:hypothetical protein